MDAALVTRIVRMDRLPNSKNGNPRYTVVCRGGTGGQLAFRSKPDTGEAYGWSENWSDVPATLTLDGKTGEVWKIEVRK